MVFEPRPTLFLPTPTQWYGNSTRVVEVKNTRLPTLIWRIIILGGTGCEHIFSCPLLPVSETKFQVRMNKKWGLPFTQTPLMGCNASEYWGPDHLSAAHGVECFTKGKASQVDVELLPLSTKFSTTKSRVSFRKKFTIVPAPNIRAIAQRFCPGEKQAYNRELQISLLRNDFICSWVWSSTLRVLSETVEMVVKGNWDEIDRFTREI